MDYDYVMIGADPAGPQLGYLLQQAGCGYIVLEAGSAAGTFTDQRVGRLPEDICNDRTDEKGYREPLRAFVEAAFAETAFVEAQR
jgi:hypothetical protein